MIYEYKCPKHSEVRRQTSARGDVQRFTCPACACDRDFKRVWAVNIHRPMADHMNSTTGTMIGSNRQFKEELKGLSEAATIKTGIEHNYEPADPADLKKRVQDSDGAGLESTNRQRVNSGLKEIKY